MSTTSTASPRQSDPTTAEREWCLGGRRLWVIVNTVHIGMQLGHACPHSRASDSDGPFPRRSSRRPPPQRPHQPRRDRQDLPARPGAAGPGRDRQGERARARPAGSRHGLLHRRPRALRDLLPGRYCAVSWRACAGSGVPRRSGWPARAASHRPARAWARRRCASFTSGCGTRYVPARRYGRSQE